MFLSAIFSHQITSKVPTETVLIAVIVLSTFANAAYINYDDCRKYQSDPIDRAGKKAFLKSDSIGHVDYRGLPLLFMGWTWDTAYFMTTKNFTANYFRAALNYCDRFGLQIAKISTACEYGIVDSWFKDHFPTTYSAWIGGLRLGYYKDPFWITKGYPIDFSQFNVDVDFIGGQYPPGGYSPLAYPWNNCLSVSRNCPIYTSGPTNPCEQTPTYPELQFSWDDCKLGGYRVICQLSLYNKKDMEVNEKVTPETIESFPSQDN